MHLIPIFWPKQWYWAHLYWNKQNPCLLWEMFLFIILVTRFKWPYLGDQIWWTSLAKWRAPLGGWQSVGEREDTSTICSPPVPCRLYQCWHICYLQKVLFPQKWVWRTEGMQAQFILLSPAQHWLCVWYRRVCILHGLCNDKKTNREETRIKDTLQSKRKGDSTNWSPVANYWRLACLVRIRILPKKSQSYNVQLCALLQYTNIVLIRCEYIAILHLKAIVQCTSATNFQCSANTV